MIIRHDLPGGSNHLYVPRPSELSDEFLYKAGEIAARAKSIFLKIDLQTKSEIRNLKFEIRAGDPIQPRRTLIIDLTKPEDKLLGEMHPKTRYNIRLAERYGVRVFKCDREHVRGFVDTFLDLLVSTSKRDGFSLHPRPYYQKLIDLRGSQFANDLFFAEYRGEVLAAALVNYYQQQVTYLHGASSSVRRNVMAPHLLHWRIMQDAKKSGFFSYDFWGIDEKRWPGVSRFKLGFGGSIVEYPESVDIVFRPMWYRIYKTARKVL